MPKPKRIFISHSSKDRDFVEGEIISLLRSHGIDTWYSNDDIQTASQWKRVIVDGLESCDWFLVALSPSSVASNWVEAELDWAFDNRINRIVAVIIEDCRFDKLHLLLRNLQNINFTSYPLDARERLLRTWGMHVAIQQEAPPKTPSTPAKPKPVQQPPSQKEIDRIQIECPNGHRLNAKESLRGKRVKCPTCSVQFVVPKSGEQAHQPEELITNSIGMKLKLITTGEFLMGDSEEQHQVKITKPFYLGVYPVTQEEYERVIGSNPSRYSGESRRPVESISWYDANSGDTTQPVGEKRSNPWGLHDMYGNVWEWCWDWYEDYEPGSATDPWGPNNGSRRVLRGGSFGLRSSNVRSAQRNALQPVYRYLLSGFRASRTYP